VEDYCVNFAMAYLLNIWSEYFFGALLYLIHVWKIAAAWNKEEKWDNKYMITCKRLRFVRW
jgi:hypothetical protein